MKPAHAVLVFGLFLFACLPAAAQKSAPGKSAAAATGAAAEIREGARIFGANCGRCHNPPQDLSPREATAVIRQMRVKAMLSNEQERALLKLLAPNRKAP